jgi:hypothetical protein
VPIRLLALMIQPLTVKSKKIQKIKTKIGGKE